MIGHYKSDFRKWLKSKITKTSWRVVTFIPDFAPIVEAVSGKYNLHKVDPDGEAIKEIYLGEKITSELRQEIEIPVRDV